MPTASAAEGPEIFAARRSALMGHARERGLKTVLAFGHGSALGAGSQSHGAFRYLCGWDGHESSSLLVLTENDAHLLVGSPFMVPLAHALRPDLRIHDVRPADWGVAIAGLAEGLKAGTVGFAEMPSRTHGALGEMALGPALDDEVSRLRLVKDEAELRLHRDAAGLCDDLFAQLSAELAQRIPAWQVQLNLEMRARRAGAEYCRTWLTVAPEADYCRYWREEAQRTPETGDQALLGIALTVDGHWGHGIRMGSIGPQRPEHRALAGHVEAMLEAGLAALRPGLPLSGVEAAMEDVMRERAVEASLPGLRRFRSGHGLGYSYEDPLLTDAFRQHFDPTAPAAAVPDLALAPGMLFQLHPNLFAAGTGGAALGEMVLVTDRGPECLLRFPRACVVWT